MKKALVSLILTVCLLLPIGVFNGVVLFAPESPFAQLDEQREKAVEQSLGDFSGKENEDRNVHGQERYIVKFKDSVSLIHIEKVLNGMYYELLAESEERLFAVAVKDSGFIDENSDIIEYSEADLVRNSLAVVNDPEIIQGYEKMEVYGAWDISTGKESVIVAVLDTGVDRRHEDLKNVKLLSGYDAVSGIVDVNEDTAGHGTGVIGLIAATANNNLGIAGIAHGVSILPIKVAVSNTTIYSSDLIKGIRFAADAGAKVINMSIGGYASSYAEQAAVDYAVSKGCILISAAGNDGKGEFSGQKSYPASYEGVISVASVDASGNASSFSQYNDSVDVAAYGEKLPLPYVDGDGNSLYKEDSGTSFSCAFVSGIAALAVSLTGDSARLESEEFLSLIIESCGEDRNDKIGYGIINARKILNLAVQPIITGVSNGKTYSDSVNIGFNRGTATLDGESIEDGQTVIANGRHTLVVTDGENKKTVTFRLEYDPISYKFYEFPSYAYFEFDKGTAFLDGFPYASGERITKSGRHLFVLTEGDQRLEKSIDLSYTLPTVYGVEEGKTYNRPIEISVIGDGSAELDGKQIYGKTVIYTNGDHKLKLISGNGAIIKEIKFTLNCQNMEFIDNDFANGKAFVDEENGFVCLYGDTLVGARIYDISALNKYLCFLPVGEVYGHAVRGDELLLFGVEGVTVIDRAKAKSGKDSVKAVYKFEDIGYYTYFRETVYGFGSGNMYFLDEIGVPAKVTELGFDCEKAFFEEGKFFLIAPSADNILRIFDPVTSEIQNIELPVSLKDERIVFGEGRIAVGNKLFDAFSGEALLEFGSNFAVAIKDGRVYTANSIISVESGKILGVFPFQISDIAVTENRNYLFGTEKKAAVINNTSDFATAENIDYVFSETYSMNQYHTNGCYDRYSSLISTSVWGNKMFLLFQGKPMLYSFDGEEFKESKPLELKFIPSRVNCSNGYVTVTFANGKALYVAPVDRPAEGRYIPLSYVCDDSASANRNIYFTSGGKLLVYTPETDTLLETDIPASEVETGEKGLFVVANGNICHYDYSLNLVSSASCGSGKLVLGELYAAVGRDIFGIQNLSKTETVDSDILAIKGVYGVTSNGIFKLDDNRYAGDTAIKYSASAAIIENNTVVTFGGGDVCFCAYGDGTDVILNPEITGIADGGVYEGNAVINYENGFGYLDGKSFPSGGEIKETGHHEFVLSLPCSRNIVISFYVSAPLSKIEFTSGNRTLSVGESFTLSLRYLPTGASSVKAEFQWDSNGLSVTEDGVVTALSPGKYAVKAIVRTQTSVLEANCVITVEESPAVFPDDSGILIDRNSNFVVGAESGITASGLLELLETQRAAQIVNENGEVVIGKLFTGHKLIIHGSNGGPDDVLTVIVKGDTDGDGYLSAMDLYIIKEILGGKSFDPMYVCAADLNGGGSVTDKDYRILENILLGKTEASMAVPENLYFGAFDVQTHTKAETNGFIDAAVILSGCKHAQGVYGKLNYGSGLELTEFSAEGWDFEYHDFGGSIGFYAYSPEGGECGTAFKVLLNLRFKVVAPAGDLISLSSEGLNVSMHGECRKVKFNSIEKTVIEPPKGEFKIEISNAYGYYFSRDVYEYSITVPYNSALADVWAVCGELQFVSVSSCVVPDSGETQISVKFSDRLTGTFYYTFSVKREEAPRIDANCKLSALEIQGFQFKPVFSPDFHEYYLTVPYGTQKLEIYAIAESSSASVYISDSNLSVGKNIIKVTVYAPDGEAMEYVINAERETPPVQSEPSEESSEVTEPILSEETETSSYEELSSSSSPAQEENGYVGTAIAVVCVIISAVLVVLAYRRKKGVSADT